MMYAQALKFIGKEVYIIADDTSTRYGVLVCVAGVTARVYLKNNEYMTSHIKHVYPR